jgi:hypothetical protein
MFIFLFNVLCSRFLIKAPTAPPRKDASLGNVIISEAKVTSIRQHQVGIRIIMIAQQLIILFCPAGEPFAKSIQKCANI